MARAGDHDASLTPELLDELAAQRRAEWQQLIDRELVAAYRLAAVILGSPAEAEDAAHDSLLRAWRSWSSLRDPSHPRAWFQRIVVNVCRDRLRDQRRTVALLPRLLRNPLAQDPASGFDNRDAIGRAFATLSPDIRAALALRFYADRTIDEIARTLSMPAGTVKSRIHRGLRQLRDELEASGGTQ